MSDRIVTIKILSHRNGHHQYFRLSELVEFVSRVRANGGDASTIVKCKRFSKDRGAKDAATVHLEVDL